MTDYRPVIDQVAELLGAENYGDVVPRLTAVLEIKAADDDEIRSVRALIEDCRDLLNKLNTALVALYGKTRHEIIDLFRAKGGRF